VDGNRDGEVEIGSFSDKTEEEKPYIFWVNNDEDTDETDQDSEKIPADNPDGDDNAIEAKRDLEDFTRLTVHLGGLHDAITQGNIQVGLKWKDTGGTSPEIKVWRNLSPDGGMEYLTDNTVAGQHLGLSNPGHVQGTTSYIIPTQYWVDSGLSENQPNGYILFEGVEEGKGQLVMTLHDSGGAEIGEGPGVWLELVNVRSMYKRVKATGIDESFEEPSQTSSGTPPEPTMGWVDDPNGNPHDENKPKSWEETKQYIVFVHGWNMSYEGSQKFAETMFKRLWQRGYKGRYAFMRWPTLDDSFLDIPYTYNASEYRAWKCGESLKQFVNSLPSGYVRNVTAHSMGNIVAGSALQKGMSMANYALLNAAVPAACYDDSSTLDQGWGYTTPHYDPDAGTQNLSYRYKLNSVSGNLINFYLPDDDALEKWELNNYTSGPFSLGAKPQRYNGGTTGYYYDPAATAGQRLGITYQTVVGRFVTTPHEAMSYVAQSPTKTVGADGRTAGSIGPKVDMTGYSFGDVHSAEWNFTLQDTTSFYNRLLDEFGIPRF
jgi:pimeloyl-ACP methyl ester carboxylesterase